MYGRDQSQNGAGLAKGCAPPQQNQGFLADPLPLLSSAFASGQERKFDGNTKSQAYKIISLQVSDPGLPTLVIHLLEWLPRWQPPAPCLLCCCTAARREESRGGLILTVAACGPSSPHPGWMNFRCREFTPTIRMQLIPICNVTGWRPVALGS